LGECAGQGEVSGHDALPSALVTPFCETLAKANGASSVEPAAVVSRHGSAHLNRLCDQPAQSGAD
jgi:hypothetical protein